jgi:hypothetical protein
VGLRTIACVRCADPQLFRQAVAVGAGWWRRAQIAVRRDGSGKLDEHVGARDRHRVHGYAQIGRDVTGSRTDVEIEAMPGANDAVGEKSSIGKRPTLVGARAGQRPILAATGVEDGDRNTVDLDRFAPSDRDLSRRGDANPA